MNIFDITIASFKIFAVLSIAYFLWLKVILLYYRYFYYLKQGIPTIQFPWPVLGNLIIATRYQKNIFRSKLLPAAKMMEDKYGSVLPKIVMMFYDAEGILMINDPEIANELYGTLNKYVDKHEKFKSVQGYFFGSSILTDRSNQLWQEKRKHLSAAFYKDKLAPMLRQVIRTTNQGVMKLKQQQVSTGNIVEMQSFFSELLMTSILAVVFGQTMEELGKLKYYKNGQMQELSPGHYLRVNFVRMFSRSQKFARLFFSTFDNMFIGAEEKETFKNSQNFRNFVQGLIEKRREDMQKPSFLSKGDFLTMFLEDEFFKGHDEYIIDECLTVLFASTQTTTIMTSNTAYFLSNNPDKLAILRSELLKMTPENLKKFQNLSDEEWSHLLLDKELVYDCNYLSYCINESMRMETPVRVSTRLIVTEDVTLSCGYSLLKGQAFMMNMNYYHHNPDQWIAPDQFMPERFDPASLYYLTPSGKKRNPASFGPFLGGRRICLGKTVAENIGKCIIAVVFSQLNFHFVDENVKIDKPPNSLVYPEPILKMKVTLAQ